MWQGLQRDVYDDKYRGDDSERDYYVDDSERDYCDDDSDRDYGTDDKNSTTVVLLQL